MVRRANYIAPTTSDTAGAVTELFVKGVLKHFVDIGLIYAFYQTPKWSEEDSSGCDFSLAFEQGASIQARMPLQVKSSDEAVTEHYKQFPTIPCVNGQAPKSIVIEIIKSHIEAFERQRGYIDASKRASTKPVSIVKPEKILPHFGLGELLPIIAEKYPGKPFTAWPLHEELTRIAKQKGGQFNNTARGLGPNLTALIRKNELQKWVIAEKNPKLKTYQFWPKPQPGQVVMLSPCVEEKKAPLKRLWQFISEFFAKLGG